MKLEDFEQRIKANLEVYQDSTGDYQLKDQLEYILKLIADLKTAKKCIAYLCH